MDGGTAPPELLFILVTAFAAAVPCRLLARRFRLPFSALMVLTGFLVSEAIVAAGGDTGLRWTHFSDIAVWGFLPVLAFVTAIRVDVANARHRASAVLVASLSVPLLTVVAAAGLVYLAMGHPLGFPLEAAVIAAALLAALDSGQSIAAVGARADRPGLALVIEVETVVADALAAVFVAALAAMALTGGAASWGAASVQVLASLGTGVGLGIAAGVASGGLLRHLADDFSTFALSVAAVYGTVLAADALDGSAVAAVAALGLTVGPALGAHGPVPRREYLLESWSFAGFACMGAVYFLAGVSVQVAMFTERWLAMLIGIGVALIARTAAVQTGFRMVAPLMRRPLTGRDLAALSLGGIRGAFALALVLALPLDVPWWWTVQSMVYGVVLFDLFVLRVTLPRVFGKRA